MTIYSTYMRVAFADLVLGQFVETLYLWLRGHHYPAHSVLDVASRIADVASSISATSLVVLLTPIGLVMGNVAVFGLLRRGTNAAKALTKIVQVVAGFAFVLLAYISDQVILCRLPVDYVGPPGLGDLLPVPFLIAAGVVLFVLAEKFVRAQQLSTAADTNPILKTDD